MGDQIKKYGHEAGDKVSLPAACLTSAKSMHAPSHALAMRCGLIMCTPACQVATMTPNQVESGLKGMGINLPNSITGEKAAVPQSAYSSTVSRAGLQGQACMPLLRLSRTSTPRRKACACMWVMRVLLCRAMSV